MADGRYSLDDILNEYSTDSGGRSDNKISIDDILGSYDGKETETSAKAGSETHHDEEKITLHNTDIFENVNSRLNEQDISYRQEDTANGKAPAAEKKAVPVKQERPAKAAGPAKTSDDDFEKKYERLSEVFSAVKEKTPSEPYVPQPKPDRSFSEKFEQTDLYGDKEEERDTGEVKEEIKQGIRSLFGKKSGKKPEAPEGPAVPEPPIQSAGAGNNAGADDPFEKYSAIEEKNLDDILNEYSDAKKKEDKKENSQMTLHKGITDLFTRLIPKTDDPEVSGNTELLDGMMKAKKERISRTQHVAPIERKSISDIDLNLEDKIMSDTGEVPTDGEQSELDKITALKERRSKKIKDFVLVGEEEDVTGEETEEEEQPKVIDDFESFEDAPSIAHDIAQLKGSLLLRLIVLIICFAASMYIAAANDNQGLPIMEMLNKRSQTNTYLFVNAIIGLFAAFSSYTVISCGLSKIVSLKADSDSLCAVSIVTSIASSMIMFANTNLIRGSFAHVYIPVAIASLAFNTIGKLLIVGRTQRSFRFVSESGDKYAVFPVTDEEAAQNFTRGALNDFPKLAAMRKTEFLSEFLKTSYASDSMDGFCRIFTPAVMIAAAVVGIVAGILGKTEHGPSSVYIGISVFVGVIAICTGFSTMLTVNLPMYRASKKNAASQGVILGFDCIDEFSETNSVLVDAGQLFPQGSVKLSAIKVFSDTRIDEAIVEAASLATQAGSILKNMFYDIIGGKTELLNPVESYIFEDSMGLCGWINNKRILLGSRELMVNHSIDGVPPLSKEKEYTGSGRYAVYLSISGELSAMFLVEITPTMEIMQALQELQKNDVYVMIRSVDSLVSISRLSEFFDISPEYLKLVPFRLHEQFSEVTAYQVEQRASLACSGKFSSLASLVLSSIHMKGTINLGIGLQAVSMLLGVLICLVMVVLNSFQELSASMVMTYNIIFTMILLVMQFFRKN